MSYPILHVSIFVLEQEMHDLCSAKRSEREHIKYL